MATPADALAAFLDGLDVESLWITGHHVNWETGERDHRIIGNREAKSHCSAFVAALAERLGIYVLRPPDYPQELLANRQVHWLSGEPFRNAPDSAAALGWRPIGASRDDDVLAQAATEAQAGRLVLAGFAEKHGTGGQAPGHICVVRPQLPDSVDPEGPLMISAGERNWQKAHMATVFKHHHGAWPDAVALFVHDTRFSDQNK